MKRAGFTMIELIFVIVILGILAAVAVPKLAATRDDAELSAVKATIQTALSAVPAAYTASKVATFKDAMSINEQKFVLTQNDCLATYTDKDNGTAILRIVQDGTTAAYATGGCASGVATTTQTDSNLTLQLVLNANGATSGIVYTLINDMNVSDSNITLGGNKVVY